MTSAAMTHADDEPGWATAKVLAEALPFIEQHDRATVVIKYGGHAMGEEAAARLFAQDVVLMRLLGVRPVVVHGGGPQISRMLERAGVKSTFVDGLRVTDEATMELAEMVLSGAINKEISSLITRAGEGAGVRGVGLSGKDAGLVTVEKLEREVDLGFVGEPSKIDPHILHALIGSEEPYIPVVAPVGVGEDGRTYNINADTLAGALAGALKAERMLLLTDVAGVLDGAGELVRELTVAEARALIADGVATGGMIPKLKTAISAVEGGVDGVVIIDGRRPHALLVELFTEHGAGTLVKA